MDKHPLNDDRGSTPGVFPASPYLTTDEAAAVVRLAPATLRNMRSRGAGPAYRKHGRLVRYHIDDLNAWSASRQKDTSPEDTGPPADG
jgi:excisionase family DNA binding protein